LQALKEEKHVRNQEKGKERTTTELVEYMKATTKKKRKNGKGRYPTTFFKARLEEGMEGKSREKKRRARRRQGRRTS